MKKSILILTIAFVAFANVFSQDKKKNQEPDTAYTKELIKRVEKYLPDVVDKKAEPEKYQRVMDIIVQQHKSLGKIHDARDQQIKEIRAKGGKDKNLTNKEIDAIKWKSTKLVYELHCAYLGKLSSELKPAQVDKVKDGMTYGILQRTLGVYIVLLPELKAEDKRVIIANLSEARELAMDAGTSSEKHSIFGVYKGKINNYLSKEGFDLKEAEKALKAKQKDK